LAGKSAWGRQNDERLGADSSWAVRVGAAQCRHAGGTDHECRSEGDAGGDQEADLVIDHLAARLRRRPFTTNVVRSALVWKL
jgi:hypothetical protein